MSQEFREHLTELANNMTGIDMYDNVLNASRKRRIRRTVVVAGVAVALLGGLVGAGYAVLPNATAESPPASGDDKKDESRDRIPGQLYYSDDSGQYFIVDDGESTKNPWTANPAVSHDGKTAAWLESAGFLMVEDKAGTMSGQFPPTANESVVSNDCIWPAWSPVDDQLLYAVATNGDESKLQVKIRDVPSGDLKASFPADGACNFTWAADGSGLVAQKGYEGTMVTMDTDGSGRNEFDVMTKDTDVSLFSVSAGSEEICVAQGFKHNDDELYSPTCNVTIDPDTGEPAGLAAGDGGVESVFYTADGNTLVRESTESGVRVTLYDPDREVLAQYDEPKDYANRTLAHYLP